MARRAALLVLLPFISVAVAMGGGAFAESVTQSADVLGTSQAAAAAPPSAKEVEELSKQVGKLTTKVEKLETLEHLILAPIAVLVGVLAL
ncbi:MAG TPA: hypothetical protein VFR48_03450, partial [Solirubrobacteraceae bacterium]|nr:hypothetical protein [Solirubrobacteraceae bacterium]